MSVLSSGTQWDAAGQISSCDSSCSWQSRFSVKNHGVEPNVGCISTDRPMATSTHLGSSCDHWEDMESFYCQLLPLFCHNHLESGVRSTGVTRFSSQFVNSKGDKSVSWHRTTTYVHYIFVITILMIMLVRWPRNWWGEWKNVLCFVHKLDSRNWWSYNHGQNVCDQRPSWPLSCAQ